MQLTERDKIDDRLRFYHHTVGMQLVLTAKYNYNTEKEKLFIPYVISEVYWIVMRVQCLYIYSHWLKSGIFYRSLQAQLSIVHFCC